MIALLLSGIMAAKTVILGGLVSIVPNALFARILFKHQGAQVAKQIVKGFYKGEAAKLLLTILMFGLVFSCFKIYPLVFFTVYILVQMLIWFAPLLFNNN